MKRKEKRANRAESASHVVLSCTAASEIENLDIRFVSKIRCFPEPVSNASRRHRFTSNLPFSPSSAPFSIQRAVPAWRRWLAALDECRFLALDKESSKSIHGPTRCLDQCQMSKKGHPCQVVRPQACLETDFYPSLHRLFLPDPPMNALHLGEDSPHTGQILCPPTSHKYHRMFLQIMALPRHIRDRRLPRRQFHSDDLSHGRIGLLRLGRVDFGDDGLFLVTFLKEGGFGESSRGFTCAAGD